MPKFNVNDLIEYDDARFLPKVLTNRQGYRLVLLNLRKGQGVPEHANKDIVTVYAVKGHITFYDGSTPVDLRAGEVVQIEANVPHHLEAHEDSSLLVVAAGNAPAAEKKETESVIDVREIPGPQRHPLIFQTFDRLSVGESLNIVNDHDPIPLHRQFDDLRAGQAEWTYAVRGPEIFRIRIRRIAALKGSEISPTIQREGLLGIRRA
ncbi:MAG: DUF2249 domain-containing protein [Acidobacteriaceae bacterium]